MRKLILLFQRLSIWGMACCVFLAVMAIPTFVILDHFYPPPLPSHVQRSVEVVDADGLLLRGFATKQGRWRLQAELAETDRQFVSMLLAYEDQRFWTHKGVDPLAIARAGRQLVTNGRIVSGGSTITMQLARLLEPRQKRSIKFKVMQIFRALQLERRLGKKEILQHYLTLAPYGGNLEGVRAASLAYFGKEPKKLSLAQSALLVSLPQAPERRRPDRFPNRAERARDTVLIRMAKAGVIVASEVERVRGLRISKQRRAMPRFAAHLSERARRQNAQANTVQLTIKRSIQNSLEAVGRKAARQLGKGVSLAMVLVDARSGHVLAEVGSANYLGANRDGWVEMTRAIRSPGSALKPFIYGLAFEEGIVLPETLIVDSPSDFAGYRPRNFDMKYQGEVSVRKALQLSLNVPAVHLLEAVGPARLISGFKKVGVKTVVPNFERPGLAIGLGGIGISLRHLTQLYTALANGGRVSILKDGLEANNVNEPDPVLLQPGAAWQVTNILSGSPVPKGANDLHIAYKTGTSYGYRDAWSVGFDGRYVLGVWVGRPDNGSVAGMTGFTTAAPILFEAFARTGLTSAPFAVAPEELLDVKFSEMPITLKRFQPSGREIAMKRFPEQPPHIIYPPEGARVELAKTLSGELMPVVLKLQDGRPPFSWLADGKLLPTRSRKRTAMWRPQGSGYSTLTVIDAAGRAASVNLFVETGQ